ncbi:MAG: helix-turn-helix transcriptional regulator [Rubrobacter sp.]|nr:helix-turn-helix transcriptional regulator [Rubrobacter sp.]
MRLERMKDVRRDRGLTQTELAERIGSNQSYVSKIERGMTVPERVAEKIAGTLMCPVADLTEPQDPVITLRLSDLSPEVLQAIGKR